MLARVPDRTITFCWWWLAIEASMCDLIAFLVNSVLTLGINKIFPFRWRYMWFKCIFVSRYYYHLNQWKRSCVRFLNLQRCQFFKLFYACVESCVISDTVDGLHFQTSEVVWCREFAVLLMTLFLQNCYTVIFVDLRTIIPRPSQICHELLGYWWREMVHQFI